MLKVYLQPWSKGSYLFRVQNMKEVGSKKLIRPKHVKMEETTLTGIYKWSEWEKKKLCIYFKYYIWSEWKEEGEGIKSEKHKKDEILPL